MIDNGADSITVTMSEAGVVATDTGQEAWAKLRETFLDKVDAHNAAGTAGTADYVRYEIESIGAYSAGTGSYTNPSFHVWCYAYDMTYNADGSGKGTTPGTDTSPGTDAPPVAQEGRTWVIQTGSRTGVEMKFEIGNISTEVLGIPKESVSIGKRENASKAIDLCRDALNQVSTQRAELGAIQNRLEHKITNLDNTVENVSAAESRIRDVDIAKEMTNFTKNQILSQAATAMLAQANALPQGVLSLLQ